MLAVTVIVGSAHAQFSGSFAPSNWTFSSTTTGGDGSVITSGAPSSIVLRGSDNNSGSCCDQYEQYTITVPSTGTISFSYSHVNPDLDDAQYVVNGTPTLITDSGSGTKSNIAVSSGGTFAFRVTNYDNCCGRGVLTITNFVFTPASPVISVQPANQSTCSGGNATFSITATNTTSYQWQENQGSGFTNLTNVAPYSGATSTSLTITAATAGMSGYTYRCIATGSISPAATSNSASLTINSSPAITAQPAASTVCSGGNTIFSVTASNATSYQWQVDQGSGFSNLTNVTPYSGVTTSTLTITGATTTLNGYAYRCVATGTCSPPATSSSASLTVNASPSVTAQPASSTICAGTNTTYSVTASNATSYQWQADQGSGFANLTNVAPYSGVTSSLLTITAATSGMNNYVYRCIITGTCAPSVTSGSATLIINPSPAITAQPANRIICDSGNTTFVITASNATSYQWQVDQGSGYTNISNGAPYSGATTATLTITGASASLNGYSYRCVASGTCSPAATSNAGSLTINASPAITSQPSNSTICAGANTLFSVTTSGATSFQWQVDQGSGFTNISNGAPYSGATSATLTITGATAGLNGYSYRCVASGTCTPPATSTAGLLTVNVSPVITAQPVNSAVCDGNNTTFSITATNASSYQWQVNTGSGYVNISNGMLYGGATSSSLTITGATAGMSSYAYRCVSTGVCSPAATSGAGILTVNSAPVITAQPSGSTICAGNNTTFSLTASGATSYQWQVDQGSGFLNISNGALYSGATTSTLTITSSTAGLNGYSYRCVATGVCSPAAISNSAVLTINVPPAITAQPLNSSICAGNSTTFSVTASNASSYQWQVNQGSGFVNLTESAPYSGVTTSTVTVTGATSGLNGYTFRCVATGSCAPVSASNPATLTVNVAPAISAAPSPVTVCTGGNTTFSVTVSNASSYQWQVDQGSGFTDLSNNTLYSGANTSTLTLTGITAGLNGYSYRCVAGGICAPAVTSDAAALTVNIPPTVTVPPAPSTICEGDDVTFSVSALNASSYQWQVDQGSGFANLPASAPYSGVTSSSLTITAASSGLSGYAYRCVVSGVCSPAATSAQATLTVNVAPVITAQPAASTICSGANASFVVVASNATSYQWQVDQGSGYVSLSNDLLYSGATSTILTITGAPATLNNYSYRCVVGGVCAPAAISDGVNLTVNVSPVIVVQPLNSTVCSAGSTSFSVTASNGTSYQWQVNQGSGFANISNISPYSGATSPTLDITGVTAGLDGYSYRCVISGSCSPSVASNGGILRVNTAPAIQIQPAGSAICEGGNTTFSLTALHASSYQWQVNQGSGFVNISNTSPYSGSTSATLSISGGLPAMDGYTYRCVVTGLCSPDAISDPAMLTINIQPSITGQPVTTTICDGNNTTYSITASGATSYQWQVDTGSGFTDLVSGLPYAGVTSPALTISNATAALDGYVYRCIAGGVCAPAATSASASLLVNTPPSITTQPSNTAICSLGNTTFSVVASDATSYQWQVDDGSGFTNLTVNSTYSGVSASTLHITSATIAMDGYLYRCVVSGVCSPAVTSASVSLTTTENIDPVITACPANITADATAGTCGASVSWTVPTASDNCAVTSFSSDWQPGDTFSVGTTTVTYVARDASGNTTTCTFDVIIVDTEKPSFLTCPSDIVVSNDATLCGAVVNFTAPVGTDNCTGQTTVRLEGLASGDFFPLGTTTQTYIVTDAAGNSETCSFTVTVEDQEVPQIICPSDITVNNDPGTAGAVVNFTAPAGTDNCSGVVTELVEGAVSGSFYPVGTTTQTYKVTDASGNSTTCSFAVTVVDAEPPVVTLATSAAALVNSNFTVTFSFSEPVAGFDVADITVVNGSASGFTMVTSAEYSALITPTSDGTVSVALSGGVATDLALNGNVVSNTISLTYDGTAPAGYLGRFNTSQVNTTNVNDVSFEVSGAEAGATMFYSIMGSNHVSVTGTASVDAGLFNISGLDLSGLADGEVILSIYLVDPAGNTGATVTDVVIKTVRNIVSVTSIADISVAIRTTFDHANVPAAVEVEYATGENEVLSIVWDTTGYNGMVAASYNLVGELVLPAGTTNLDALVAHVTVTVLPNIAPVVLLLSNHSFQPAIASDEPIGQFTTEDEDDTEFDYALVSGPGAENNDLFLIDGDKLYLKDNQGLSGQTTFRIRARSTDSFGNTVEEIFSLEKTEYSQADIIIHNTFSPNGDGINDYWIPSELKFFNDVTVEIFDRSGVRLFKSDNPEEGWDGRAMGGRVLDGPFFYIIHINDLNVTKKGIVISLK